MLFWLHFFFSSRRRHTRWTGDWSSDVCSSDLGLSVAEVVESATGLIAAGKARVWGVLNWPADEIAEAGHVALAEGVPAPCAAQRAYNLVWRSPVEDEAVVAALDSSGASVVASAVLGFGALTGRGRTGRA